MNRFILTSILSLLVADNILASEQPGQQITCNDAEIAAQLERIEDIQKRDLIWNYAVKICGDQINDSSGHRAVVGTLANLEGESLHKTADDILQLAQHPDLRGRPDCPFIIGRILCEYYLDAPTTNHDELVIRLKVAPTVIDYFTRNNLELGELGAFVNSLTYIHKSTPDATDVDLALQTCETIAKDKKWSAHDHASILFALAGSPKERLMALPHAIAQAMEGHDDTYQNDMLLMSRIIQEAPVENLTEFLTRVFAFAKQNNVPPEAVANLIGGYSLLTQENEEQVLKLATFFMKEIQCEVTDFSYEFYFRNFIDCAIKTGQLASITESKIKAVIEYAKRCGFESGQAGILLNSVVRIPDENVDGLLKAASVFCLKQNWPVYEHANFIGSCQMLPIDRATLVFDAVSGFVGGDTMQPYEYGVMCCSLGLVPFEQLGQTLTSLKTLVHEKKLSPRIVSKILYCSYTDPTERIPHATKLAISLLDKGLIEEFNLTTLLANMVSISTDRFAILCDVLPEYCTTSRLSGKDIYVFAAPVEDPLEEVPAARMRLAFKTATLLTAGKNWEPAHHVKILTALGEVHPDHMDQVLEAHAAIVEDKDWDGKAHAKIIRALAQVPAERRRDILKTFAQIIHDKDWTGKEQANLIITLSLCHTNSMTEVLEKLESVTQQHDCDAQAQTLIIQALSNTSSEEWDQVLKVLKPIYTYKNVDHALDLDTLTYGLLLFPESVRVQFIESFRIAFEENPEQFYDQNQSDETFDPILSDYIAPMDARDNDDKQQLFDYWKDLMQGDHPLLARLVCSFIQDQALTLGLEEEDEIVQMAMRVLTVLEDGDERGAHVIYEKLKAKREVPIQWEKLKVLQGCVAGLNVRLNPIKIASLGASLKLDLSSVPNLKARDFVDLLNQLKSRLKSNEELFRDASHLMDQTKAENGGVAPDDVSEDEEEEAIPQMQLVEDQSDDDASTDDAQEALPKNSKLLLKLIDNACTPTSHFCRLMNAASKSMEGSRMKCVANHFMSMPDEDSKWIRICQFLSGVRACEGGMNTAIQDYYMCLTPGFKLKSLSGCLDYDRHELPAVTALFNAMQSVVSMQFSPESRFMKEVCGTLPGQNLEQAAHQIIWVKGLIGDRVGLTEGPRFDINAGTINQLILAKSQQEIIELYYNRLELNQIIPLMKTAFDRLMKDDKSIYKALAFMCEKVKVPIGKEDFYTWTDTHYADEDDYIGETVITERGMVQVMTRVGLLDPVLDPLGGGN